MSTTFEPEPTAQPLSCSIAQGFHYNTAKFADLLWVGPAATRRKLVGQAYADDLAGIAATQQGLQRVVHAVHLHSLRWGWRLNVPKSIVMVFGTQSLCAGLGAPELWWGDSRLPTADTVRPCAQGRCGRCPPGSGVMSGFYLFFFRTDSFRLMKSPSRR